MAKRLHVPARRLQASPKGGASVSTNFQAKNLEQQYQSQNCGAQRMEILPVLFLMQPASSLALVQTNLGLGTNFGLGLGLVTNSESPAHQHQHLVR